MITLLAWFVMIIAFLIGCYEVIAGQPVYKPAVIFFVAIILVAGRAAKLW